jgi:hypothetical protein
MPKTLAAEKDTSPENFYFWIDRNNKIFLVGGILLMAAGIIIDILFEKSGSLWVIILSHLFLILGEALIVFFLINVVLEAQYKERFLSETKNLIASEKNDIISSFEELKNKLISETNELVDDISNNIFKVIIQEKTSKEIADIICDDGFFKSDFLKIQKELVYRFEEDGGNIILKQFDDFDIENISETENQYSLNLSLTSTVSKTYKFRSAKFKKWDDTDYTIINEDHFTKEAILNVYGGQEYTLKDKITLTAKKKVNIHRSLETIFIPNPDGIDDYFFTTRYMMPFPLKVIIPEGYDFMFSPTFPQNKLKEPIVDEDILTYEIPFLFPGQGFFFSLVKKSVNQTNPLIVNVTGNPDPETAAVLDLAKVGS